MKVSSPATALATQRKLGRKENARVYAGGCKGPKNSACVHRGVFSNGTANPDHCHCLDKNNQTLNTCASGAAFRRASYALDGSRAVMANEEPPLNSLLQPNTDVRTPFFAISVAFRRYSLLY